MAMHSLQLLLGIALGLCFFIPPPVQSGDIKNNCGTYVSDDFEDIVVLLHNFYRAHVYPPAADMKRMVILKQANQYLILTLYTS